MVRASLTGSALRVERRDVDQMQEHARALQVLQEADAETGAVRRTLDETRDVRHDEASAGSRGHHPEIRVQRGERVIGDFRPRRRNRADQCRFAGIRQTEQAHIRNQLQFQCELALFARQSEARFARSAVGARLEARVAPPAFAALGDQQGLAFRRQVAQLLAGIHIGHHRADRHGDVDIVAAVTGAIVAAAGLAVLAL